MILPQHLRDAPSWTLVGPMGPSLPKSFIDSPVLAVDGGANYTNKMDVWVGDSDSVKGSVSCELQVKLPKDKDTSDLANALGTLSLTKAQDFHLWGFLGGRKDHELFNLGECSLFLSNRPGSRCFFYNEQKKSLFQMFGAGLWEIHHSGTFSLGSFLNAKVSIEGQCRYPIHGPTTLLPLSSLGLSNIAEGTFVLKNSAPVFLIFQESL